MEPSFVFSIFALLRSAHCDCRSIQGSSCCAGFFRNAVNTCEKCPIGLHGLNCSETCEYPGYGDHCQSECQCKEEICDYRIGCLEQLSTYTLGSTVTYLASVSTISVNSGLAATTTKINSEGVIEHGVAILYGIFAFVGIFVLLFGTFLGIYIHKQCFRRSLVPEGYGVTNQSQFVRYNGLARQTRKEDGERLSTDPMYLDPVQSHSVEIESHDIDNQLSAVERNSQTRECNIATDDSAYLTPCVKDSDTYVEILDKTNSL